MVRGTLSHHAGYKKIAAAPGYAGAKGDFFNASRQQEVVANAPAIHDMREPADRVFGAAAQAPMLMSMAKAEAGKDAVERAKVMNKLKSTVVASDDEKIAGGQMKSVEDKTFYMVNGFWTDRATPPRTSPSRKKSLSAATTTSSLCTTIPALPNTWPSASN